jgi:endonuclease/exonuclease/phosphatase family metal-dependent hydrolase
MRLDYVLTARAAVKSLDVLDAGGSDHLPVVARVVVNQAGQ